jgi:hypothetical protein
LKEGLDMAKEDITRPRLGEIWKPHIGSAVESNGWKASGNRPSCPAGRPSSLSHPADRHRPHRLGD